MEGGKSPSDRPFLQSLQPTGQEHEEARLPTMSNENKMSEGDVLKPRLTRDVRLRNEETHTIHSLRSAGHWMQNAIPMERNSPW